MFPCFHRRAGDKKIVVERRFEKQNILDGDFDARGLAGIYDEKWIDYES